MNHHSYLLRPRLLILCALLFGFAITAHSEKFDDYCGKCKNTGQIDCKFHSGPDWTVPPYKSSAIIEHKCGCCGIGWTVCKNTRCSARADAQIRFDKEIAPLLEWVKSRRAAVELLAFAKNPKLKDVKALHAETRHFYLSGTFKKRIVKYLYKGMVKERKYDPDESLHLYAERIEVVYDKFVKMIRYEGDYMPRFTDKWKIMVWESEPQQDEASRHFCGFSNTAGAKVDAVLYTTWDSDDDLYLHHKLAHAISCLFVDDFGGVQEFFPEWFTEAIAHWIEYDIFNELRIFTAGEGGFEPNCPTRKLKSSIKKELKGGGRRIQPLGSIINKKLLDITGWERLKCWSVVDWMVNAREDKCIDKLIVDFKNNYPTSKQQGPSIRTVFDMTPEEIDDVWAKWVLDTYPIEEDD